MRRTLLSSVAVLTLIIGVAPITFAQTQLKKDMAAIAVSDDMYAAGGNVSFSNAVRGDLIAAGGELTISSPVTKDLLAAGGQVSITGNVGDDVRIAGGTVLISGKIAGDLVVAGGTVTITNTASVGGSLMVYGGTVLLQGPVKGNARIGGGDVTVDGTIGGSADINSGTLHLNGAINGKSKIVADQLVLGPKASLRQAPEYWTAKGKISFGKALSAASGTATFNEQLARSQHPHRPWFGTIAALLGLWGAFSVLSTALLMGVFFTLFPKIIREASERIARKPGISLLVGFLYYAVVPVVLLLLCLSVIGIPLAFILLAHYLIILFFGSLLTSLIIAQWIEKKQKAKWHWLSFLVISVLIYIALKILWFIPFIGWAVRLVVVFMGVGSFLGTMWNKRKTLAV